MRGGRSPASTHSIITFNHSSDCCIPQPVMQNLFFVHTDSPVGPLFLASSTKGLVRLEFEGRVQKLNPAILLQESEPELEPYICELNEYFAGKRREFSMPLDLRGTAF